MPAGSVGPPKWTVTFCDPSNGKRRTRLKAQLTVVPHFHSPQVGVIAFLGKMQNGKRREKSHGEDCKNEGETGKQAKARRRQAHNERAPQASKARSPCGP
jgi:hypothetical protein